MFTTELREGEGVAARALEFAICAAARSREVRGASWLEIDWEAALQQGGGQHQAHREADHAVDHGWPQRQRQEEKSPTRSASQQGPRQNDRDQGRVHGRSRGGRNNKAAVPAGLNYCRTPLALATCVATASISGGDKLS